MSVFWTRRKTTISTLPNISDNYFNKVENLFKKNILYLRESKGETQTQTASALGLTRSTLTNYENGYNEPKMDVLCRIIEHYGISFENLMFTDLSNVHLNEKTDVENNGKNVHPNVHPSVHLKDLMVTAEPDVPYGKFEAPKVVTIDISGTENVVAVPVKARAGYLLGFGDPEFVTTLPAYNLPGLRTGTYRLFEVAGGSMFNTLQDGDEIVCRWATVADFRDDRVYVIIHNTEGVLVKRCIFRDGKVIAKSDNNHRGEYPTQVLHLSDIHELWYAVRRFTRHLSQPGEVYKRIIDLEGKVSLLEDRLNKP
jgi:transcriptional regulator with XRE-family HTH domain/signal peptidase I